MGLSPFVDPAKLDTPDATAALNWLGVEVKVINGDNDVVAEKLCADTPWNVLGTTKPAWSGRSAVASAPEPGTELVV